MINIENCPDVSSTHTKYELISYLVGIRNAGTMNMYDSAPYLSERFDIPLPDAEKVVRYYLSQQKRHEPR